MKLSNILRNGIVLGACLTTTNVLHAQNTNLLYRDFTNTSGLVLNGAATNISTRDGEVMRVVYSSPSIVGSVFTTAPLIVTHFSTMFTFRFTSGAGNGGGADGFVFVVQSVGPKYTSGGSCMGYQGFTNSVGVEFDIYYNSECDPDGSHIAIDTNGVFTSTTASISPDMKDGDLWFAWVDYNGSALEVRVNKTGDRPALPTLTSTVNITNLIHSQNGYVGFTAATGSGYMNHDIISWGYNSSYGSVTNIDGISPAVNIQTYAGLTITGSIGTVYQVQYLTNLVDTNSWTTLTNLGLSQNPYFWIDNTAPASGNRFYRVVP